MVYLLDFILLKLFISRAAIDIVFFSGRSRSGRKLSKFQSFFFSGLVTVNYIIVAVVRTIYVSDGGIDRSCVYNREKCTFVIRLSTYTTYTILYHG